MNKFIEYDIHNGITQLKVAIMNILSSLDSKEIFFYRFGEDISTKLIKKCILFKGWVEIKDNLFESPSNNKFIFNDTSIESVI